MAAVLIPDRSGVFRDAERGVLRALCTTALR
jgi:hypothetical protein